MSATHSVIITTMGGQYLIEDSSLANALSAKKRADGWFDLRTSEGRRADAIFRQIDALDESAWRAGLSLTDLIDGVR